MTACIQHIESQSKASCGGFSPMEYDILRLLVQGYSNLQIADLLYLSPHLIMSSVEAILARLDVKRRTQAALRALKEGLV